jgi:hypothetical protein
LENPAARSRSTIVTAWDSLCAIPKTAFAILFSCDVRVSAG